MTQTRVYKAVKEVSERLGASRQFYEQHNELEKNLCATNGIDI